LERWILAETPFWYEMETNEVKPETDEKNSDGVTDGGTLSSSSSRR